MKKIFTIFFTVSALLIATAQTVNEKTDKNTKLKPVYRITHEGVVMYYEMVKEDSASSNSDNTSSAGTTSPAGSTYSPVSASDIIAKTSAQPDNANILKVPLDVVDVSPNPFKDDLSINIHKGFEGMVSIKILDLLGNTAYRQQFTVTKEDELIGLDLSNAQMKSGIYIMRIEVGGTSHIMRIVKR